MPNQTSQQTPGPFSGLVVVELGHSVAAPFAGQIFGELGARVIKIEKSDGDDCRKWGPPFWEGASTFFQTLNRNKESVVCDLRDADQLEALKQLICDKADIVIQNLRPGHVEQLGLDGPSLLKRQPRLIYCNLGAFGRVGPLKDRPGYDPLMQAFGGIMSTTGEPGRPSVRVGASIVDMGTGMWSVIGALTALHERNTTGHGRVVDVSLFETAASWVSLLASQYLGSGVVTEKQGSGAPGIVPYKAYATQDGEIIIAAGSDGLFKSLAKAIGHAEWLDDERFKDNPSRVANKDALYGMIDQTIAAQPTKHWIEVLEAAGVPCSPVNNLAEMIGHPQTEALGLVQPVPGTGMRFIGLPLSFDGVRPAPISAPPKLGEHNALLAQRKTS
ncbi:CoA transferase [Orrella sp. NBD-18]|uniref:CoA transferase n=1 Tax=Sheuella amnicola TaxID=2707330 RepID=A0A6B2QZ71_9BURK|nr:CoA transferase [Sheuella amnicola]NDY82594.1 CoA transferase [Sheuella amnicola]